MKSIRFNLSALVRPVRFLIAVCACAFLIFSYATPAYSATNSKLTQGEENLTGIEQEAQELTKKKLAPSREEQMEKSREGLSGVQGKADVEKFKRPERSKDTGSPERTLGDILEKVGGGNK